MAYPSRRKNGVSINKEQIIVNEDSDVIENNTGTALRTIPWSENGCMTIITEPVAG
jgi:hypothetical protein